MSSIVLDSMPRPPLFAPVTKKKEVLMKNVGPKFNECLWASEYPDIQQSCYLSQICTLTPPKLCRFKNINPVLQEGPTCGLTCIKMLVNEFITSKELLDLAKLEKYTNNGEMFSAKNLCKILKKVIFKTKNDMFCQLYEGQLNCSKVKNLIAGGACLIVPYDPDYNHSPCLKQGHKAHWALIIGYLIDPNDNFYVIARHGKTKNRAIWDLKSLSDSNSNLIEFCQPKAYATMDFLIPEGGIGGPNGLLNKSIIVENLKKEDVVVL